MKIHNFNAGPSIITQEILNHSAQAVINYNNSGLSLLEMSHRSKEVIAIMEDARVLALELLNLKDKGYQALFLTGGASLEFLMIPYNLMKINGKAAYFDTGTWANNAIKQAKYFGETVVVASSKSENYSFIPKNIEIPTDVNYFHCTSNNTIFGTQMKSFPDTKIPVVCDMSSDIFSRVLDFKKFDLIYAGAQKNVGSAGTTLVIIKEDILNKTKKDIPSMLNYQKHIDAESMLNTPPVFAIYTSLLTMEWIKKNGGIVALENINNAKAKLIYNEIDRNPLFIGTANIEDRSTMNATFLLKDEKHTQLFDKLCAMNGISGLKGHRSVGGYRASMYNAMPIESVAVLVDVMKNLETKI